MRTPSTPNHSPSIERPRSPVPTIAIRTMSRFRTAPRSWSSRHAAERNAPGRVDPGRPTPSQRPPAESHMLEEFTTRILRAVGHEQWLRRTLGNVLCRVGRAVTKNVACALAAGKRRACAARQRSRNRAASSVGASAHTLPPKPAQMPRPRALPLPSPSEPAR